MLRAQYIPVSRLHLSTVTMSSAHRKTRLRRLAGKSAAAPLASASPRGDITRDTQHKFTIKINRVRAHAGRTRSAAARGPSTVERVEARARNTRDVTRQLVYNVCGESGKALGVQGALEAKSPDPLHERGFHL